MAGSASNKVIKTAVITGGHDFDVVGFHELFRTLPDVNAYPQNMEDFVTDTANNRDSYDALLFYNMHLTTPGPDQGKLGTRMKEALETLGESRQGIFVLHHGLVAFPDWPLWGEVTGLSRRSDTGGAANQTVQMEIADPDHPITRAMEPWVIVDEIYGAVDADEASHVLLRTEHPGSMKTIAWTREYRNARVVCFQSGHDKVAFDNPGFRSIVGRGLRWAARKA